MGASFIQTPAAKSLENYAAEKAVACLRVAKRLDNSETCKSSWEITGHGPERSFLKVANSLLPAMYSSCGREIFQRAVLRLENQIRNEGPRETGM